MEQKFQTENDKSMQVSDPTSKSIGQMVAKQAPTSTLTTNLWVKGPQDPIGLCNKSIQSCLRLVWKENSKLTWSCCCCNNLFKADGGPYQGA